MPLRLMTVDEDAAMTARDDEPTTASAADDLAGQVQDAIDNGSDIRADVERITRAALTSGHLDLARIRRVVHAVAQGATEAVHARPTIGRQAVGDALEGLHDALRHSAKSARLAIEEAAGRVDSFSEGQLRQALQDLGELESLTLDTLDKSAAAATHAGGQMIADAVRHARRNGSRLGTDVDAALRDIASGLPEAMREASFAGLDAVRETGARAAEATSGVFSGLATALRSAAHRAAHEDDPGSSVQRR